MSLDLYFTLPGAAIVKQGSGIFIRENGQQKEISREEWDRRYPDREPVAVLVKPEPTDEVFSRNITHNLGIMAIAAGLYDCLWLPNEHGITTAEQMIEPLLSGIAKLKSEPDKFKLLNPENGWGNYDVLLEFAEQTLVAARAYPAAIVSTSR